MSAGEEGQQNAPGATYSNAQTGFDGYGERKGKRDQYFIVLGAKQHQSYRVIN